MKTELLLLLLGAASLTGCCEKSHSRVDRADFQAVVDGKQTDLYTLRNRNGVEITVTNYGAHVVEVWVPDRDGRFADVVLGHDALDKYVDYEGERFLGATIGRYGNRIAGGRFTLDGTEYNVPVNDGPNSLHGGVKGFDRVVWDARQTSPQRLELSYVSPDGEEGYPGTLSVEMVYELTDDNEFRITHDATTDRPTVVNLTHHSFFNLHGAGEGTINDHELMIAASRFTPIDSTLIPTGELAPVEGTPLDFRTPHAIGERVDTPFRQLDYARGYDHNFVLDRKTPAGLELAATVYEPRSGRYMEVWTTEPGLQFYGGNFFDGTMHGKQGKCYDYRASLALETQHFPDSPNQPAFPSTELRPGDAYHHVCVYKFGTK